jgi:hypothetical protein
LRWLVVWPGTTRHQLVAATSGFWRSWIMEVVMRMDVLCSLVGLAGLAAVPGGACTIDGGTSRDGAVTSLAAAGDCSAPGAEGAACDDGLFCTVLDRCHAGVCIGEERPCASVVGFCALASCDEDRDTCVASPRDTSCVDLCASARSQRIYRRAWLVGFEAVSLAWDRRGANCARSEAFVDRITQRFETAQQAGDPEAVLGEHRRCRKAGVLDGAYAALDVIQNVCDQTCFLDGTVVGDLAAVSYCEIALAGDGPLDVDAWLRGPVGACGLNYEIGCDATYVGMSTSYQSAAGACEPVTAGAYEVPWDRTRARACDYPE